jgi:hypothetical protein
MQSSRKAHVRWWAASGLGLAGLLAAIGCGSGGSNFNGPNALAAVDASSTAGPIDTSRVVDAETIPRDKFGRTNTVDDLIYPSANADERSHFARGLAIFSDPAITAAAGQGPYFNERVCLGCHTSQQPGLVPGPASRGATGHNVFVFGDFTPVTGAFDARANFGGPVFHFLHLPGFPDQVMPPVQSPANIRVTGGRQGPPYIGRGLMEAVPDDEILSLKDPAVSQLVDAAGNPIAGFENRNSEAPAFVGASPVRRLSRFGLRAAGPSLLQLILAGASQEVGLTSPFNPAVTVASGMGNPHIGPGLTAQDLRDIRTLIRLVAPPAMAPIVPGSSEDRGRILFGADFTQPQGLAKVRNVNCVSCHTPIMITGASPADVGARHLSNKRFFIFSDMLLHDTGQADADDVLNSQGRATGKTWRTPPLMGIGLIGPPFFHDARAVGSTIDEALDVAIDDHDHNGADIDEATDSIRRYRALPDTGVNSKADLINFIKTL